MIALVDEVGLPAGKDKGFHVVLSSAERQR